MIFLLFLLMIFAAVWSHTHPFKSGVVFGAALVNFISRIIDMVS
jgi:hypothetical protein